MTLETEISSRKKRTRNEDGDDTRGSLGTITRTLPNVPVHQIRKLPLKTVTAMLSLCLVLSSRARTAETETSGSNCSFLNNCHEVYCFDHFQTTNWTRNFELAAVYSRLRLRCKLVNYIGNGFLLDPLLCPLSSEDYVGLDQSYFWKKIAPVHRLLIGRTVIRLNTDNLITDLIEPSGCDLTDKILMLTRTTEASECVTWLTMGSFEGLVFIYPIVLRHGGELLCGSDKQMASWGCESIVSRVVRINGYELVNTCEQTLVRHTHRSSYRRARLTIGGDVPSHIAVSPFVCLANIQRLDWFGLTSLEF